MGKIKIIEASAGSGKTHRLTVEYIKHLVSQVLSVDSSSKSDTALSSFAPEYGKIFASILAITFTNKATEEMKERIIRYLKAIALKENPDFDPERKLIGEVVSTALSDRKLSGITEKRIQNLVENLFINYSDFNVKTIDSLMSSFVKILSPELKLPPDTPIEIDFTEELNSFATEYLEELVDENWELITGTITELLTSGETVSNTIDRTITTKLTEIFEKLLRESIDAERAIFNNTNDKREKRSIKEQLDQAYDRYRKILESFYRFIQEKRSFINGNTIRGTTIDDMKRILENPKCNISEVLNLTNKKLFKKDIYEQEDLANLKLYKKGMPGTEENTKEKGIKIFKELLQAQYSLIEIISKFKTSRFFNLFIDFTEKWEKRKNRTVYVSELSKLLKEKLKNLYPYIKLSDRFIHFLFDEFQDTSEIQFEALSPLIDEVLSSEEKASFLAVGDKKQAIYRWRGGKSELMNPQNLREYFSPGLKNTITPLTLTSNYRSLPSIVEFNNTFWNPENIKNSSEDKKIQEAIINNFRSSHQECAKERDPTSNGRRGYVEICGIYQEEDETSENTLRQILEYIDSLTQKGYKPNEIAILTRKNEQIKNIIAYLESNGIPTITDESLKLSSVPVINEIISFMRFIEYPPDNLSFFTFITGEIVFKLSKSTSTETISRTQIRKALEQGINQPLYKFFINKYPNFWESYISYFYKSSGLIPPYDFFQDMTLKFRLYENFRELSPFLLKFSDILHELEQKGITSIAAFLKEWDANLNSNSPYSLDSPQTENAVTVMTIHKSKGLDFPVVIVPIIKENLKRDNIFIDNGQLYHITQSMADACPKLKAIYRKEYQNRYIDTLNLLYVAFTRAKEALLIPIEIKENNKKNPDDITPKPSPDPHSIVLRNLLLSFDNNIEPIIPPKDYSIREKLENLSATKNKRLVLFKMGLLTDRKSDENKTGYIYSPPINSKIKLTNKLESDLLVFSRHTAEIKTKESQEGEKLHRMLSQLEMYPNKEQFNEVMVKLCKSHKLSREETTRIVSYFLLPQILPFYIGDGTFKNEQEIIQYTDKDSPPERKRIDRLVIRDEIISILDYKFGNKEDSHYLQLKEYGKIIKDIYRDKKIEAYILYIKHTTLERVI